VTITYLDTRVLRRAVEIAGGEAELALRLEVSPHRLSDWLGALAPSRTLQRSGASRDRRAAASAPFPR
jgi:DNA-binding transcriptional regulator YdaS (Cro superfamily)